MKLPVWNSARGASFLGRALGAITLFVVACGILAVVDTIGLWSQADFVPVEGVVRDFQTHQPTGRGTGSVSFTLEGQPNRLHSNAVTSVHPSWLGKPAIARAYLPADPERRRTGRYGTKTFGLWVNGVEQQSLRVGVHQSTQSALFLIFFATGAFVTSLCLGYSAYRMLIKNKNED